MLFVNQKKEKYPDILKERELLQKSSSSYLKMTSNIINKITN